jgi:hypothetical protein
LKTSRSPGGKLRIKLCKNGLYKLHSVHLIVLTAFRGSPGPHFKAKAIDGDFTNVALSNLEWVRRPMPFPRIDGKEWLELSDETFQIIRYQHDHLHLLPEELSLKYEVSLPVIYRTIYGSRWRKVYNLLRDNEPDENLD